MGLWTAKKIRDELVRQRAWKLAQIRALNELKDSFAFQNDRLLKRRASYNPKKNGKGRPPKALAALSKRQKFSRAQAKFDVLLLDEILDGFDRHSDPLVQLEEIIVRETALPDSAMRYLRLQKLDALKRQFTNTVSDKPAEWSPSLVRDHFTILLARQRGRGQSLAQMPLRHPFEKLQADRERARRLLLERIIFSNHLQSANELLRAMRVWRPDFPVYKANDIAAWRFRWQETIERIWQETSEYFVTDEISPQW
jgi:hypothetical protein